MGEYSDWSEYSADYDDSQIGFQRMRSAGIALLAIGGAAVITSTILFVLDSPTGANADSLGSGSPTIQVVPHVSGAAVGLDATVRY